MAEKRALLRIREGAFTYLLATDQAVSIERKNQGSFELLDHGDSTQTAWYIADGVRVPVYRLGVLLRTPVAEWGHAIVLSDGGNRIGVAAEQVQLIPENQIPVIKRFNPLGSTVPGGAVVVGVCPDTEPEYLVLDVDRLQRGLSRPREA